MSVDVVQQQRFGGSGSSDAKKAQTLVPVFNVTVTDEQLGLIEKANSSKRTHELNRICKLLEDQFSANLLDRHEYSLSKLCKTFANGFLLRDLFHIIRIIHVLCNKVDQVPQYVKHITDILKICSRGFLKEKNSDEVAYEELGTSIMCQFGYLIKTDSLHVQRQIADTILKLFNTPTHAHQTTKEGYERTSQQYHRFLIERSDAPASIVKAINLLSLDKDTELACIVLLQKMSRVSAIVCDQLNETGATTVMCRVFSRNDPGGEFVFRIVEIIWNLLDKSEPKNVIEQLCLEDLQSAFLCNLTQTHSIAHRQLRNDLLTLISLVAYHCPAADFLESGLIKQIVTLSTFPELQSRSPLVAHLKIIHDHEDFEMKKQLWNILVQLSRDQNYLPVIKSGFVLLGLGGYLRPNGFVSDEQTTKKDKRDWSESQFEELQLHAMSSLATLLPLCIEEGAADQFMEFKMGSRILNVIEWTIDDSAAYLGTGNSFFGCGGHRNKRAHLRYAIRLLFATVSAASSTNPLVLADLADQNAISLLVSVLERSVKNIESCWDAIEIETQADIFVIISSICERDQHRKELFSNAGVDVICRMLKMLPPHLNSGLGHQRLLLCIIECAWSVVVGCDLNESYFLEKDGIFIMMDLCEFCPMIYQPLIYGCLVDILENPKSVKHLLTWRGRNNITAPQLFLEAWRNEEAAMGVMRGAGSPTGQPAVAGGAQQLASTQFPLMTENQIMSDLQSLPPNEPNIGILDIAENLRCKIFSIFLKIGFNDLPGLNDEGNITKAIVERYLDFKLGEVWREIEEELRIDHIEPIEFDAECLDIIQQAAEEKASIVIEEQSAIIAAANHQTSSEELHFYSNIRSNQLQRQRAFDRYNDLLARTSRYDALKIAHKRQQLSIDASRPQQPRNKAAANRLNFHSLELANNNQNTVFSGRKICIDSTANEIIGGRVKMFNDGMIAAEAEQIKEKTETK